MSILRIGKGSFMHAFQSRFASLCFLLVLVLFLYSALQHPDMNSRKLLLKHIFIVLAILGDLLLDLGSAHDITCENATAHPSPFHRPSEWTTTFELRALAGRRQGKTAKCSGVYLSQNLVLVEDLGYLNEVKKSTKLIYNPLKYQLENEITGVYNVDVAHVRQHPNFVKTSSQKATKDQFVLLHLNKLPFPPSPPCLPFAINLRSSNFTIRTEAEEGGGHVFVFTVSLGKEEHDNNIYTTVSNPTECHISGNEDCVALCGNNCKEKFVFKGPGVLNKMGHEFRYFGLFRERSDKNGNPDEFELKYDRLGIEAYDWIQKNKNCSEAGEFTCTNGDCIDIKFVCNGQNNCADNSDEEKYYCPKLCPEGKLPCGIGKCYIEAEHGGRCKIFGSEGKPAKILTGAGIAFALIVGGIITIYWRHTQKLKDEIRSLTDTEVVEFLEGTNVSQLTKNEKDYARRIDYLIRSTPWDREKEIPRRLIKIEKEITRGHFGIVSMAKLLDSNAKDIRCEVAVKMPISSIRVTEFKALLDEVKIMSFIGSHENVVRFFGACTDNVRKRDVLLVMEFCTNGSVLDYLRNNGNVFYPHLTDNNPADRQTYGNVAKLDKSFNTNTLLKWAIQTAAGMEFLTSLKILHRDIAARNLLLSEHLRIKIADFGLSRKLEPGRDEYTATSGEVPWKWLAPEAFEIPPVYSEKSDIWAFGVTIWEIFSLGESPYNGREWSSTFHQELIGGLRLPKPKHGTDELCALMTTLWKLDPKCRPTFKEAKNSLLSMLKVFHDDSETTDFSVSQEYFHITD